MTTLLQGLANFSGQPLVHALGWTLLHFCWQGLVVAAMLWCVLQLLGPRSSQARYGAACLALALMVIMPTVTFARVASADLQQRAVAIGSGVAVDATFVVQTSANEPVPPWPARVGVALDHSVPWLLLAWLAGVLVFAGRLNFGLLIARRLKTAGTEAVPDSLRQAFEDLRVRLGVQRAVELLHSAQVQVPTVIGWLRPVVLLPASCLTGLSPDQIEAVLCHELAHVRRHDYLVSVIQSVIETVLFYHPAVWWVSKQVRRERECCCDELAVDMGGDVLAYARALSFLEESRAEFPEFVLGANGGALKMRIRRLLGGKGAEGSPVAALVALGMIFAVAGTYFISVEHAQAQARAAASHAELASAASPAGMVSITQEGVATPGAENQKQLSEGTRSPLYREWLDEDVRWIITPEERAAFDGLANDDERDSFINQFWARRDSPGATAGSYREQHYARIAYSNEHFGTNDQAGWHTDRGHIYIVYGKPDEVFAHPSAGADSPYPYEVWHYKYIAGIGDNVALTFVDTCQCGQYNLTIDRPGLPAPGPGAQNGQARAVLASRILAPGGAAAPLSMALPVVRAEEQAGSISGTIPYPDAAGVPVKLINTETGFEMAHVADNQGRYIFSPLPPGTYMIVVEAPGHARAVLSGLHIAVGQTLDLPVKLAVGAAAQPANSSQQPGIISGSVVDPNGALVQHAKVTTINTDTGVKSTATTDEKGHYEFSLPVGPYILEIEAPGFQRLLQENLHVNAGETLSVNLKLTVGGASESLTVKGAPLAAAQPPVRVVPPPAAPKPSGPQRISSGVMQGLAISQPQPVYPDDAKAQHVQGVVVLRAHITKQGTIQDVQVVSGPPPLIVSAIDAVRQWKYKPFLIDGAPTEVDTTININYTLDSSAPATAPSTAPPGAAASGERKPTITYVYIRSIDYQGLSSVTISQVADRFAKDGVWLKLETAYDEARVQQAVTVLKKLLAEHEHPNAVVKVSLKVVEPGGVGIHFDVNEGPKGTSQALSDDEAATQIHIAFEPRLAMTKTITASDPAYPAIAKASHTMGSVVLLASVSESGEVQDLKVLLGQGMLVPAAMEQAKQIKFDPAKLRGEPSPVSAMIGINFTLAPAANGGPKVSLADPAGQQWNGVPVRKLDGSISQPEIIYKVDAESTEEARKAAFSGIVLVNLIVDQNGVPQNVHVLRGVGMGLDEKAVEAVRQYRFKPAKADGQPVPVALNVEVDFQSITSPDNVSAKPASPFPIHVVGPQDRDLYDRGTNSIANGWYPQGRQVLEELISKYPNSPLVPKARAAIADSLIKEKAAEKPAAKGPSSSNDEAPKSMAGEPLRKIGSGVSSPELIYKVDPEFSPEARKAKLGGTVLVNFIVDKDGKPENVHLVHNDFPKPDKNRKAIASLDKKAVDAVTAYRFKPAKEDGNPVPVDLNVEVNFRIF